MSQRANPLAVGLFIAVALLLLVSMLFFFGAGDVLRKQERFVLYFEGSITGLRIGAPVTFQGVQIGQVADIRLRIPRENHEILIPVVVEIDRRKFPDFADNTDGLRERMIARGLRAQLKLQSVLTSLLMVELDFFPDTPVRLVTSGTDLSANGEYTELPTVPTPFQALLRDVDAIDLNALVQTTHRAIEGIEKLVNHPDAQASVSNLNRLLVHADAAVTHFDGEVVPALRSLRDTLARVDRLTADVHQRYPALASELELALRETRQAVQRFDAVMEEAHFLMSEDSALYYDLQQAAQDVSEAAQSVRQASDTLNNQPEALLYGKPAPAMKEE